MRATETFKEAMKERVGLKVFRAKNRYVLAHDMMNFLIPYGGASGSAAFPARKLKAGTIAVIFTRNSAFCYLHMIRCRGPPP